MPSCAIRNCKNRTSGKRRYPTDVKFFSFPRDEKIAKEWAKLCGNPNLKFSSSSVCSAHFEKSSFKYDWREEITYIPKRLKPDAIPTIGIGPALTNIVCKPTKPKSMEPINISKSYPPPPATPMVSRPPFENISVKSSFFINFKDNSGGFLNQIGNQARSATTINSHLNKSPLIDHAYSGNITNEDRTKDTSEHPVTNVTHDHDYLKTNAPTPSTTGPELRHDKGNIYLTINLTQYSKVVDIKRICGIVLVLNDQPTQSSENKSTFTNQTVVSNNELDNELINSDSEYEIIDGYGLAKKGNKGKGVPSDEKKSLTENFHMNQTGEKEFSCPKCETIYYSPKLLLKHFKKEHDSSYKYNCPKCSQCYQTQIVLKNHIKREHFIQCQFCDKKYETAREYKYHLKTQHSGVPYNICKPYYCEQCDEEYTNKDTFFRHMRGHGGFFCSLCAQRFDSKDEYTAHEKTHPNKYFCEICDKGFKEKQSLKSHSTVHNDPIFTCDICQQRFKVKSALRNHVLAIHDKKRPFMCDKCSATFYCQTRLFTHIRSVHDKIKPFQCPECDKKFSLKNNLQLHYRIIHLRLKPFQCEFCGKQFAKKDALTNHRHIHTGTPRKQRARNGKMPIRRNKPKKKVEYTSPVDCSICGKTLKSIAYLKPHLNTHARIRRFKCGFCGLMFLHQTSKIRHEKSHEADPEHKFVCPICWKRMKTKEELDMHINQHNNREKRHKCDECGEAFCRRMLLENHILLEHTNPEEISLKSREIDEVLQAVNSLT